MISTDKVSVFALMKARMQMLSARQKTLAQNVANVSTPRYTPQDVDMNSFAKSMLSGKAVKESGGILPALTNHMHMQGSLPEPEPVKISESPDSETTLDGNSVVVEEQMSRIASTRTEFETVIGLYRKSLDMLRMASRDPSR